MELGEALGIQPGDMAAFVGAGGKTTSIWRIQGELATQGLRSILTTTTKIMEPVMPPDGALMLTARPDAGRVGALLDRAPRLALASRRLDESYPCHADHPVPSRPYKVDGLPTETLNELVRQWPGVTWLVEADGAKGCGLKLPAAHEPVIPGCATIVVVMAHLDVLGCPLDETTVHRVTDATRALGVPVGTPLAPAMFARVLTDDTLGFKGIPHRARAVALLTQRGPTLHADALALAEALGARYSRVVIAALRADKPVLQVRIQ
jgi:probable selenium-dependent hydroxylase accessory protein YqeC